MSSNVRPRDVLDRLQSSSTLNALSDDEIPHYTSDLEEYDYVFEQSAVEVYLALTIEKKLSYKLSLELSQWEVDFEGESEFVDSIVPIVDLLESKFLHEPEHTIPTLLIGYNQDENTIYRFTHDFSMEELDPEEHQPRIMQDFDRSPVDIDFGSLKAISEDTFKGEWIGSSYIFENGLIVVMGSNIHKEASERSDGADPANTVVPFLYEGAHIDHLVERYKSDELDLIYLSDDINLPKEVLVRSI